MMILDTANHSVASRPTIRSRLIAQAPSVLFSHGAATYNVTGPNARVNINSHDHSTNTVTFEPAPVFADLRRAVVEAVAENSERAKLLAGIEAMENGHRTHTFVDRYKDFITLAANHMTIVAPFLPALSALLGRQ